MGSPDPLHPPFFGSSGSSEKAHRISLPKSAPCRFLYSSYVVSRNRAVVRGLVRST